MSLTVVSEDDFASRACRQGNASERVEMAEHETKYWADSHGTVFSIWRGDTDQKITGISFFNTNGTEVFMYPNAAGNGPIFALVKP